MSHISAYHLFIYDSFSFRIQFLLIFINFKGRLITEHKSYSIVHMVYTANPYVSLYRVDRTAACLELPTRSSLEVCLSMTVFSSWILITWDLSCENKSFFTCRWLNTQHVILHLVGLEISSKIFKVLTKQQTMPSYLCARFYKYSYPMKCWDHSSPVTHVGSAQVVYKHFNDRCSALFKQELQSGY
ncbi:hypothetical protein GDO81_009334 [Engystomops pustulosus]|uniref:Uncharacterized protein n=1 Tax=Engystomops pustulosus TaxID=76066 RepID=A0AAV7BR27_ENGPU|nr:hypothetical protein GDO81_009334 [Engystomops pustulosus]